MEDISKQITDEQILDLVLMNEEPCFHNALYQDYVWKEEPFKVNPIVPSFAKPVWEYVPKTAKISHHAAIRCPVCGKKYEEASKRLKKQITFLLSEIETESVLDEVTV